MSRSDALVIIITMSLFAVLTVLGIWSLARRDKARAIWFSVFALMMGTLGSFILMAGLIMFILPGNQSPFLIIAVSLPIMAGFVLLLYKTKVIGMRGKLAIVVVVLLLGFVAGRSTAFSAHAYQAVRDAFVPLLQKEYAVKGTAVNAEPCFVLYDLDAKEFNFAKSGLFTHYSTDVDKINAIVFYSKSTKLVGEWVTEIGNNRVADAHSEFIKVTVVDVKTWSVVASESFEGVGTPDKEKGNYTNRISITDNQIQGYLNNLFSTTDG
ncbi:MAG: hypothetical protein ACYDHF_03795 [Candidatus Cryosericum sp.]